MENSTNMVNPSSYIPGVLFVYRVTLDSDDREVTDERLLLEFLLSPDPAMFTSEIAENLPVTRQRVGQILPRLEKDGFLTSKQASGRNLWWLTPEGREYITDIARDEIA